MIYTNNENRRGSEIQIKMWPLAIYLPLLTTEGLGFTSVNEAVFIFANAKAPAMRLTSFTYSTTMQNNGMGQFQFTTKPKDIYGILIQYFGNTPIFSWKPTAALDNFTAVAVDSYVEISIDNVFICNGVIDTVSYNATDKGEIITFSGQNAAKFANFPIFYDYSEGAVLDNNSILRGRIYEYLSEKKVNNTDPSQTPKERIQQLRITGPTNKVIGNYLNLWLKEVYNKSAVMFANFKQITDLLDWTNVSSGAYDTYMDDDIPLRPDLWDFEGTLMECINSLVSYPFDELYWVQGGNVQITGKAGGIASTTPWPSTPDSERFVKIGQRAAVASDIVKIFPGSAAKISLKENKMYLVHRMAPYNDKRYMMDVNVLPAGIEFPNLEVFLVKDDDIISVNVAKSNSTLYSQYSCSFIAQLISAEISKILIPPTYDHAVLRRIGYKPLATQIPALDWEVADLNVLKIFLTQLQKKLREWNGYSHHYLNGTIQMKGFKEIVIGEMLKVDAPKLKPLKGLFNQSEFYIEGYTHEWSLDKGFTSTVNVSRGVSRNVFELMSMKNPLLNISGVIQAAKK